MGFAANRWSVSKRSSPMPRANRFGANGTIAIERCQDIDSCPLVPLQQLATPTQGRMVQPGQAAPLFS